MYPWDEVKPELDSTLRLIHEAVTRGHRVAILTPNHLTIRKSVTSGFCKIFQPMDKVPTNTVNFYKKASFRTQMLPLSGFDAILVRTNPPLDPVMLNFLDSVRHDTFILNDLDGLRKANNKLYPAAFDDPNNEVIPETHVSKNKDYLLQVIEESPSEQMILKPFGGFGGQGVIVLEKGASQSIKSLLDFYVSGPSGNNYVILQEFVPGAEEGDIRVLMLNGEPIGATRRVPAEGDIRSNVSAGGRSEKYTMNKAERELCKKIGPKLVEDGLYFVGLDIIGGKLIEINVCSPGGITNINKFNRVRLQEKIIGFVEEVVQQREVMAERKRQFRQTIERAA